MQHSKTLKREKITKTETITAKIRVAGVCWRATTVAVMGCVLSACIHLGEDFPPDTGWIEIDVTTQHEISKKLGVPQEIAQAVSPRSASPAYGGKTVAWTYYYLSYALWRKPHRKELRIFWYYPKNSKDNVLRVKSYTYTTTADHLSRRAYPSQRAQK